MHHQGKMHMKFTAEKKSPTFTDWSIQCNFKWGNPLKYSEIRQMTDSQNNLSQQLPDHWRELGIKNVKVQGGGDVRDSSLFLSQKLTHSGGQVHSKLELL